MPSTDPLREIPFFRALPQSALEEVAAAVHRRVVARGTILFQATEPAHEMFIVRSGQLRVYLMDEDGRETTAAILSAGSVVGEMGLLDDQPRSANLMAMTDAEILVLSRSQFDSMLARHPELYPEIVAMLARRLRRTTQRASEMAHLDVVDRVARMLVYLAERHGQELTDGVAIDLPLTQTAFAALVGASRESVNRALTSFREEGVVSCQGRRWVVHGVERLCRTA